METLVLATHSRGKIAELTSLLAPIHCIPQTQLNIPEVAETGLSFIENALIKARHACRYSDYPAMGDDSGLVIDALNGAPGIYSARFAGETASDEANIEKVLQAMQNVPAEASQAYFYCAIAVVRYPEDPTPILSLGRLDGRIIQKQQGSQGFGYDPIFWLPDHKKTLADISMQEKNLISHRAQALKGLMSQLRAAT